VDPDRLVKNVLGGQTLPEAGQLPYHGTYGFAPNVKAYPYDPDQAGKLLDAAGNVDKFKKRIATAGTIKSTVKPKKERKARPTKK